MAPRVGAAVHAGRAWRRCARSATTPRFAAAALAIVLALAGAPARAQQPETPGAGAEQAELPLEGSDAAAYRRRAERYAEAQDLDRAVADYGEALKRAPDDLEARRGRADSLYFLGRFREAVEDLAVILAKTPDDARSHALRGMSLGVLQDMPGAGFRSKADFETALADYEAALRLSPEASDQSALLAARSDLYATRGETAKALQDIEAAVKLDAAVANLTRLASARLAAGDRAGALEILERAVAAPWNGDGSSAKARRDLMALKGPGARLPELPSVKGLKVDEVEVGSSPQGDAVLRIRLDKDGAARFTEFTSQNVGRRADLMLGEDVLTSAIIREPITGGSLEINLISGEDAAKALRDRISNGEALEVRAAE